MSEPDLQVLDEIQRRVLWLSTRIVDAANRERQTGDGVKEAKNRRTVITLQP